MSVRKDINDIVYAGQNGERILEDAIVYATTKEEALSYPVLQLRMASTLTVIETGGIYMLDNDGDRGGVWRSVADGSELS